MRILLLQIRIYSRKHRQAIWKGVAETAAWDPATRLTTTLGDPEI